MKIDVSSAVNIMELTPKTSWKMTEESFNWINVKKENNWNGWDYRPPVVNTMIIENVDNIYTIEWAEPISTSTYSTEIIIFFCDKFTKLEMIHMTVWCMVYGNDSLRTDKKETKMKMNVKCIFFLNSKSPLTSNYNKLKVSYSWLNAHCTRYTNFHKNLTKSNRNCALNKF